VESIAPIFLIMAISLGCRVTRNLEWGPIGLICSSLRAKAARSDHYYFLAVYFDAAGMS